VAKKKKSAGFSGCECNQYFINHTHRLCKRGRVNTQLHGEREKKRRASKEKKGTIMDNQLFNLKFTSKQLLRQSKKSTANVKKQEVSCVSCAVSRLIMK
jgi:hypothetical protein